MQDWESIPPIGRSRLVRNQLVDDQIRRRDRFQEVLRGDGIGLPGWLDRLASGDQVGQVGRAGDDDLARRRLAAQPRERCGVQAPRTVERVQVIGPLPAAAVHPGGRVVQHPEDLPQRIGLLHQHHGHDSGGYGPRDPGASRRVPQPTRHPRQHRKERHGGQRGERSEIPIQAPRCGKQGEDRDCHRRIARDQPGEARRQQYESREDEQGERHRGHVAEPRRNDPSPEHSVHLRDLAGIPATIDADRLAPPGGQLLEGEAHAHPQVRQRGEPPEFGLLAIDQHEAVGVRYVVVLVGRVLIGIGGRGVLRLPLHPPDVSLPGEDHAGGEPGSQRHGSESTPPKRRCGPHRQQRDARCPEQKGCDGEQPGQECRGVRSVRTRSPAGLVPPDEPEEQRGCQAERQLGDEVFGMPVRHEVEGDDQRGHEGETVRQVCRCHPEHGQDVGREDDEERPAQCVAHDIGIGGTHHQLMRRRDRR